EKMTLQNTSVPPTIRPTPAAGPSTGINLSTTLITASGTSLSITGANNASGAMYTPTASMYTPTASENAARAKASTPKPTAQATPTATDLKSVTRSKGAPIIGGGFIYAG